MKQFYEIYKDDEKVSTLLTQLSWSNHLKIISGSKSKEEREFQKSILENLKNFILEIGKDFSFIGNEYRVQVGNHDYYIDLLFYHRGLSCLVAFELKIGEFKPEYIGKMNLYLEALDREVKKQTNKI